MFDFSLAGCPGFDRSRRRSGQIRSAAVGPTGSEWISSEDPDGEDPDQNLSFSSSLWNVTDSGTGSGRVQKSLMWFFFPSVSINRRRLGSWGGVHAEQMHPPAVSLHSPRNELAQITAVTLALRRGRGRMLPWRRRCWTGVGGSERLSSSVQHLPAWWRRFLWCRESLWGKSFCWRLQQLQLQQ